MQYVPNEEEGIYLFSVNCTKRLGLPVPSDQIMKTEYSNIDGQYGNFIYLIIGPDP